MYEHEPVLATLTDLPHLANPALYGRSEVRLIEGTKPVKKARKKLETMQQLGILSQTTAIHEQGLSHVKNGDVYVQIATPDHLRLYIRPDIMNESSTSPQNICIVTGCCLFGEHHARAVTTAGDNISLVNRSQTANLNGGIIESVQTNPAVHPYELDTIIRLSAATQLITENTKSIPTYVHIPRFEYALYLFDNFSQGKITPDAFRTWFSAVNRHADIVADTFKHQLCQATCNVSLYNAFESIEGYTAELVRWGAIPTLDEMVQILAESNPVWQAQIDQQLPHSYVDLSNMANVVTYLDCLARHDGVVGIENPEESKILQHVK